MIEVTISQYPELMWPALNALKDLGGSGSEREIYERVVENEGSLRDQLTVCVLERPPHGFSASATGAP